MAKEFAPPSDESVWFERVNVSLDNGGTLWKRATQK
jgi:hypothetical protein